MQVYKYESMHVNASMQVQKYASMHVCKHVSKELNKKKERARPYPRLRDFFIKNPMTNNNKPYDTTPCLDPRIQGLYPNSQVYLTAYISLNS